MEMGSPQRALSFRLPQFFDSSFLVVGGVQRYTPSVHFDKTSTCHFSIGVSRLSELFGRLSSTRISRRIFSPGKKIEKAAKPYDPDSWRHRIYRAISSSLRARDAGISHRFPIRPKTHPRLPKASSTDRTAMQLEAQRPQVVVIDNPDIGAVGRDVRSPEGNVRSATFHLHHSVYADTSKPNTDESAALAKYEGADAMKETREICLHQSLRSTARSKRFRKGSGKWFPGKTLIIRPGLIVGRAMNQTAHYWRCESIAAGSACARRSDRSGAVYRCARFGGVDHSHGEQGETGNLHATGPASQLGVGEMLNGIKSAIDSKATSRGRTQIFSRKKRSRRGRTCGLVPPRGEEAGMGRISIKKLSPKVLTFRHCRHCARHVELVQIASPPKARRN